MARQKYIYSLRTDLIFSEPVQRHAFLLRASPLQEAGQEPMRASLTCQPNVPLALYRDFAGNTVHQGFIDGFHDSFVFCSTGEVLLESASFEAAEPPPYYALPSAFTGLYGELKAYAEAHRSGERRDKAVWHWMELLSRDFRYRAGVTTTRTRAAQAWTIGEGVCQDYAHILLALLRFERIPCRYVAGVMSGEGASHAWVEYYDGRAWIGVDPTHQREVGLGYLKLSQGLDFGTCSLERGVFVGKAEQSVFSRCALIEM